MSPPAQGKPLTIKEWAEDDRPREKMARKGAGALSDAELMAILIGTGTPSETAVALAQRVLSAASNSLGELGRFTLWDFTRIRGIGPAKGITIMAALELGRRRKRAEVISRRQVQSSHDIVELFQPQLADLPHEEFWVVLLNRGNRVIDTIRVSQGGVSGATIDLRIILRHALVALASGIVLCHNHPSGNPSPSDQDLSLTRRAQAAAQTMGIALVDHVIIAPGSSYSFADQGEL